MAFQAVYQYFWMFFIYAFLGWCAEVIYHAVSDGKFLNRGFLIGPVCPAYGLGVLSVILCFGHLKENLPLLFLGSAVVTSILEFAAGFILECFFRDKWWDYSKEPFNICGYVCLRSSMLWGLACVFILNEIHPFIEHLIAEVPQELGIPILVISSVLMLADASVSVSETLKLRKKFDFLSDKENRSADIGVFQARILNAYPRLKSGRYKDIVYRIKVHMDKGSIKKDLLPLSPDSPQSIRENLPIAFYRSTFETVVDVLEARDKYTAGHSRRVAYLTYRFCKVLKIPPLETEKLEMAASVHDLGKVGISDAVLNKCGKLTEEEWAEIRRHPDIGADIIMKCEKLESVAEIIRHHHEHWDGSGYPGGLIGDEIPKGSQIIAICDAVDSMMIARVYRPAFSRENCIEEIKNCKGTMFCPELADKFVSGWDYIVSDLYSGSLP
ncbi:MAG: HD domain-containing protein [Clostridiales bacterium]|nr:HD domain-containing protein [Clostridiales bacterium]